ncbi:uncharacterized protein LOC112151922 [Oryzias melastigma]|uniref:uncharacterized protein LOC112151922 n=1 Tax=Oryzias melastigma TaxID=30732 RepID=UPI00168D0107|nr:uncharacterized protein LOC112151922 [Oryzias melastigma]
MPQEDHRWVSSTLFRVGASGRLELRDNLQLWYHPPPPVLVYNQAPTPHRFFSHSLLLWMPYRLWKVRLLCTNPTCTQHQLSSGGLHRRVRQVIDIDRYYNLVTETLICTKCRTSYLSWGQQILQQLDLPHRSEFRVILTRRYACDIRVIRLLRERGLGNSSARLIAQLKQNHSEEWLQRVSRYTSECAAFMASQSLLPLHFQEPPNPPVMPSYKWLLVVYSRDILNSFEAAVVAPPVALYVDCGCCKEAGATKLQARFNQWPNLIIRLDIWHFMRRLAVGETFRSSKRLSGQNWYNKDGLYQQKERWTATLQRRSLRCTIGEKHVERRQPYTSLNSFSRSS